MLSNACMLAINKNKLDRYLYTSICQLKGKNIFTCEINITGGWDGNPNPD